MTALQILRWAVERGINFENFSLIDVPSENDPYTPQTEEWWYDNVGICPACPIPEGKYLGYYRSDYEEIDYDGEFEKVFPADVEMEVLVGEDTMYLYRIEE